MSVKNKEKVRLLADALATDETLMAGLNVVQTAEETIDTIRQDMFQHMSTHANIILQEEEGDIDLVMKVFSKFEHKYKKDNKLQSMPGSYRSSKSVIINALRHGVSLVSGDGTPKGKTSLERQIKAARKTGAAAKSIAVPGRLYPHEMEALVQAKRAAINMIAETRASSFGSGIPESELNDLIDESLEAARLLNDMSSALIDVRNKKHSGS